MAEATVRPATVTDGMVRPTDPPGHRRAASGSIETDPTKIPKRIQVPVVTGHGNLTPKQWRW